MKIHYIQVYLIANWSSFLAFLFKLSDLYAWTLGLCFTAILTRVRKYL